MFRRNLLIHNTRNNVNNVHIPLVRTVRSQKSVFYLAPKIWNTLPNALKVIGNINTFKFKLKMYLLEKQSSDYHQM